MPTTRVDLCPVQVGWVTRVFPVLPPVLREAVRACRPHLIAAAAFSFLVSLLYLAPTVYMLQVYDRVVATGGKATLLFVTLALVIALATLCALDMIRNRLLVRAGQRLDALLAPVIFDRMITSRSAASGQAMRDFDTVRSTLASPIAGALLDLPWMPVFLIAAFLLHYWIGVLALVSAALLVTLAWINQRATQRRMDVATQAMASAQSSQQVMALHGPTLRALGMNRAMVARQLTSRGSALLTMADAQFAGGRLAALSRFVRLFAQSAALGLGALLAIAGDISAGSIIAASILLGRALQPIEGLISGWSALASSKAALTRLSAVLDGAEHQHVRTLLPDPTGRVEAEELCLRAPDGRMIVSQVSFRAAPGQILGVIGPSGSGKTSLAKLICGSLRPTSGAVRIDGARLADWDQDELGRHFGYMPQEATLFEGTIKENIARFATDRAQADPAAIDAAVIAAASEAGVHQLILQLPRGYDTKLGLLGSGLSAGQAQRIALARALYGDPAVLVLDEPNASLDGQGEAALMRAIGRARQRGATAIVIAHRRGILEIADRLLVMEGGQLKLLGPTKEVTVRLDGRPPAETAA